MKNVKQFILGLSALTSTVAFSESKITEFRAAGVSRASCPSQFILKETFSNNALIQVEFITDDENSPYKPKKTNCKNLVGKETYVRNGTLTCNLENASANGYTVIAHYNEPSRDPSDYGYSETLSFQRSSQGITADLGISDLNYRTIYCSYNKI